MKKNLVVIIIALIILALAGFAAARFFLPKKTNPEDIASKKISSADLAKDGESANFTVDYSAEQGRFSNFVFTGFDSPGYEEAGYDLFSEGGFNKVAVYDNQFNLDKAKSLAAKNMEVIMHIQAAQQYETKEQLQVRVGKVLDMIDGIKKSVPNLRLTTFQFANEPNFPNAPFWRGTKEQIFEDYGYFAQFMKSKNSEYIVGGLGFADPSSFNANPYINDFVAYVAKNNLPLDFLSFHGYTTEIKNIFSDEMQVVNNILDKYPKLSPLFGRTKVAVTEMDIEAFPIPCSSNGDYSEFDGAWRAAHNTLTKMALAEKDAWMIFEVGGPFKNSGDGCFLWKKTDGSLKPIYYAYQAFNKLFGQIKLETAGSNFETYGITVGKSADGKKITAVVVNYDEKQFFNLFPNLKNRLGSPGAFASLPRQSADAMPAKQFQITLKNLPWTSGQIKYERSIVDDENNLSVVESKTIDANVEIKLGFDTNLPEVNLITLQAP